MGVLREGGRLLGTGLELDWNWIGLDCLNWIGLGISWYWVGSESDWIGLQSSTT